MICKNCGAEVSDNAIFCNNCGTKIEKEIQEIADTNMKAFQDRGGG